MPQSKQEDIAQTQANLPLPEQPPQAADLQSVDARTTNVGSGRTSGNIGTDKAAESGLREPSTQGSDMDMSGIGRGVSER
jgi:hypothetical protein